MSADPPSSQDSMVSVAGQDAPRRHRARRCGCCRDQGIGVDDINLRRPTLDDVFLSLTGHAAEEAAEAAEEEAA